eukprot:6174014-Alexandrium_andersonii.AAC.1
MSASLVGSEMCIRDSWRAPRGLGALQRHEPRTTLESLGEPGTTPKSPRAVSYTHLTLPTICSV